MKQLLGIFSFILIILCFNACDSDDIPAENLRSEPAELGEKIEAFGLDLYNKTYHSSDKDNICTSPLSVFTALAMVYNGSIGKTKDDIAHTLYTNDISLDSMNSGFQLLKDQLIPADNKVTFESVNGSFWDESRIELSEDFLDDINYAFDAKTQKLDFNKEQESLEIINGWVADKTHDKIKQLLKTIKGSDVLFLINALYFQGDWNNPFDPDWTYDEVFTRSDGLTVSVPFMHHDSYFNYYKGADYAAVELPFGESAYSMTFLVPTNTTSFGNFIDDLSPVMLHDLYDNKLKEDRILLKLPKFELAFEIELKEVLSLLGMGIAFSEFQADFSKLGNAFGQNLFIDRVIHKTKLILDETGVEGAAATAVGVGVTSVPPSVDFDRPFVYILRQQSTNTPLFIGHVGDPSKE
jgi:serpin B